MEYWWTFIPFLFIPIGWTAINTGKCLHLAGSIFYFVCGNNCLRSQRFAHFPTGLTFLGSRYRDFWVTVSFAVLTLLSLIFMIWRYDNQHVALFCRSVCISMHLWYFIHQHCCIFQHCLGRSPSIRLRNPCC